MAIGAMRNSAANAMLDRLDELRLGQPGGSAAPGTALDELARTARDAADDRGLALVLDEIDLRVAAELAKLDSGL